MNFFGIGVGELFFILVLGLLIIGPERLPNIARSLGQMIARLMAWQHNSPEIQMFHALRQDFEREIKEVRDELVLAQQQLQKNVQVLQDEQQSLHHHLNQRQQSLRQHFDLSNLAVDPTKHASQQERKTPTAIPTNHRPNHAQQSVAVAAPPNTTSPNIDHEDAVHAQQHDDTQAHASTTEHVNGVDNATKTDGTGETTPQTQQTPPHPSPNVAQSLPLPNNTMPVYDPDLPLLQAQIQVLLTEVRSLQAQLRTTGLLDMEWQPRIQIESLMADVHAIQQQLQASGHLSTEWQPPSHSSSMRSPQHNVPHE
jgi:sec-independent protein translocase protein TatB